VSLRETTAREIHEPTNMLVAIMEKV
jgi:hypothetical protein